MTARTNKFLNIAFLGLAAALVMIPLFMMPGAKFFGTDDLAGQVIAQLRPDYKPWIHSFWEPPSGEVATLLFALQAALGAGFIGYYLGSRRNRVKKSGNDHS